MESHVEGDRIDDLCRGKREKGGGGGEGGGAVLKALRAI